MDREKLQSFIRTAGVDLSSIRSSLLIAGQAGEAVDLTISRRSLSRLKNEASEIGLPLVVRSVADCEAALDTLAESKNLAPNTVYAALDAVARIEAALWQTTLPAEDFLSDISGFVDASFDEMVPQPDKPDDLAAEEFEIDDETLDIFRTEADDLLANIANDLRVLSASPHDQNALWDIRRNAHTFKGAAGIVGLKDASEIAHQMEDLLDRVVELRREAAPQVVDFLDVSAGRLTALVAAKNIDEDGSLEKLYTNVMDWLSSSAETDPKIPAATDPAARVDAARSNTTPVVRVSLERLEELIKLSRSLVINRSSVAEQFAEFSNGSENPADILAKLRSLFEIGSCLTDEIQAKLNRIRMIKFGTLETRFGRTVNVTCQDENKKAAVKIVNGEVEIDNRVIDVLIEPLLHLLKNAVVHGIEPPDMRRLIGKPEKGTIRIRIEADDEALVLSVSDDGGGISLHKLKEKALASGLIDAKTAASMSDRAAMELIFDRGLTTAGKIDLNAGRGVGMSIVKESVESRGGTVLVESEPQRGSTFTILMPLAETNPEPEMAKPVEMAEPAKGPALELPPVVLVIDDSATVRRQNTKLVEGAGFRVITADNGAEALELLLSEKCEPSLILSDVEMPQIDGWELLEYLKAHDDLGHIPVIMVTSLDTDEHHRRAFNLGATDYIPKPLNERSLERALEKLGLSVAV